MKKLTTLFVFAVALFSCNAFAQTSKMTKGPDRSAWADIPNAKLVDIKPTPENYYIPNRFAGKTILITGAARGIGQATAIRAAREGANIVVADWLVKEGQATAAMINKEGKGKAIYVKTDIQSTVDCENMVAQGVVSFGKIDYAVLNAGVMDGGYSGDTLSETAKDLLPNVIHLASDEYWDRVMNINATGTFRSMRSVLRQMLRQGNGGAITVVGSIAGITGLGGNPAYVASKHALNGLVRNAAIDYAPYGIRVNSVNMAETATAMTERAAAFVKESQMEKAKNPSAEKVPNMALAKTRNLLQIADSNHRPATVWEQASTMLYLLSDDAANITGTIMPTDGGWTDF